MTETLTDIFRLTLLLKYLNPEVFTGDYDPTIEVIRTKPECVDGEYCNMEIYEVTDHTWYNNATLMEFACQAGAQIIVVGLDSRDSYDNIRRYAGFILQNGPPIGTPLIIIANKSDLTGTDSCQITKEDLAREAASWHCDDCTLLEASAKDNFNVEEAFITAVRLGREAKRVREERRARARKEGCCIQ